MKIRENMIIPFEKIPGCLAFKVKVTIEGTVFNFELQNIRSVS